MMNENNRNSDKEINETLQSTANDSKINKEDKKEKDKIKLGGWAREMYEWTSSVAIAVVIALIINQFFFALVQVDGQSMEPTLSHGERLVVRKIFYTPQQKDVVIVKSEALEKYIVKRIVALPGQTVDFDENMHLLVDGSLVEEPYINELQKYPGGLYQYPITVPKKGELATMDALIAEFNVKAQSGKMKLELLSATSARVTGSELVEDGLFDEGKTTYKQDAYFVMGDNRNHSSDSRNLGVIPKSELVGKAEMRILPLAKIGSVK